MKHKVNIRGSLIPNDYKWYYDYFMMDATCPADVKSVIDNLKPGDEVEVLINSPGGVIDVGSEIYTMLREHRDVVKIKITGEACSAASIIAMAAYCEMAPTALMMVHCVSTGARGNHSDLEHTAEVLRTADKALCAAYMNKAGMSEEEALEMMEHETWLTAEQAKERNMIDAIMFEEKETQVIIDGPMFELPTREQLEKVNKMLKETVSEEKSDESVFLLQQKLNLLKLRKGEQGE